MNDKSTDRALRQCNTNTDDNLCRLAHEYNSEMHDYVCRFDGNASESITQSSSMSSMEGIAGGMGGGGMGGGGMGGGGMGGGGMGGGPPMAPMGGGMGGGIG